MLNVNSDERLQMLPSFPSSVINSTILHPGILYFRVFTHAQFEILLDKDFRLKSGRPSRPDTAVVQAGITKMKIGMAMGELFSGDVPGVGHINVPPSNLQFRLDIAADENPANGLHGPGPNGYSLYGSARIGQDGQKMNWGLVGRDAPWIFVETIAKPDVQSKTVKLEFRTSVDAIVAGDGTVVRQNNPFNEIQIYNRRGSEFAYDFKLLRRLFMNESLKGFIESVPHNRIYEPPSKPFVRP